MNPDTPQKAVRRAVLAGGKVLLTPQPRLRTGFFSTLSLQDFPEEALAEACTSAGAAKYGTPLGLGASDLKVDLIVVGEWLRGACGPLAWGLLLLLLCLHLCHSRPHSVSCSTLRLLLRQGPRGLCLLLLLLMLMLLVLMLQLTR